MSDELIDQLAELARSQRPSALPEDDADAMIAAALAGRSSQEVPKDAPHRVTEDPPDIGPGSTRDSAGGSRTRTVWAVAMAATVLLALGIGHRWGETSVAPANESPLRAELATGDVITAMPGARFELRRVEQEARQVAVREGVALFDVQPLEEGETFEVILPHSTVHVRGTVFSVDASDESVRVYEGEVEIVHEGRSTFVQAGGMWREDTEQTLEQGPLAEVAASAVEVRELRERISARTVEEMARAEPIVAPVAETDTQDEPAQPADVQSTDQAPEPIEVQPAPPVPVRAPTRARVRQWLAAGDYPRALRSARRHGYGLLEADALRALGEYELAADAYDAAAQTPRGDAAAFAAARIRYRRLNDAQGALQSLQASRGAAALAERELGLRAQLLHQLGRESEAQAAADAYLRSYPEGGLSGWMESLLEQAP